MKPEPPRIAQMYFDFKDWEKAFEAWDENLPLYGDQMQMVVSHNHFTSGYWIEHASAGLTDSDVLYKTYKDVQALKVIVQQYQKIHQLPYKPRKK